MTALAEEDKEDQNNACYISSFVDLTESHEIRSRLDLVKEAFISLQDFASVEELFRNLNKDPTRECAFKSSAAPEEEFYSDSSHHEPATMGGSLCVMMIPPHAEQPMGRPVSGSRGGAGLWT